MRLSLRLLAVAFICMLGAGAFAQAPSLGRNSQAPNLEPKTPSDKLVPTVTYELVLPGEQSPHLAISVDTSGNAAYRARLVEPGGVEQSASGQDHILKFTVSQPTALRIFELAREAHYFEHASGGMYSFDPTFARTSNRFNTLTYSYGPTYTWDVASKSVRSSLTYSSTSATHPAIRQLASIFESMSRALQQGRIDEAAHAGEGAQ